MSKQKYMKKLVRMSFLCAILAFVATGWGGLRFQQDNRNCIEVQTQVIEDLKGAASGERKFLLDLSSTNYIRKVSLYFTEWAPESVKISYAYPVIQSHIYRVEVPVYDGKAVCDFRAPRDMDYIEFSYDTELQDAQRVLPVVSFNENSKGYKVGLSWFFVIGMGGTAILCLCVWLFVFTKRRHPFLLLFMSAAFLWLVTKTAYRYGACVVTWGVLFLSVLSVTVVSYCLGGYRDENA